jgi:hypothetical protein
MDEGTEMMEIKEGRIRGEFDGCSFALTEEEIVLYLRGQAEGITPIFTKAELFEIEKMFDFSAGQHLANASRVLEILGRVQHTDEFIQKFLKEMTQTYDVMRTISAKANKIGGEWQGH